MEPVYQHDIEAVLKQLILRRLTVSLSKRIQKTGKLILYKIVNHNIELLLGNPRDESTHSVCLVPYPFGFKHNETKKQVSLSYDMSVLFPNLPTQTIISGYKPSKVLNNVFTITYE